MIKYKPYLEPRASRPQSWPWRPAISEFVFATVARGTRAVPKITLLAIAMLLVVSPAAVQCQKITKEKLTSEGKKRSFYLYVPASVKPKSPVPLLVLLHGSNHIGLSLAEKWKELANKEGFIVVAPDSIDSAVWGIPADGPVFMRDLVEELKSKYRINSRKVYLFGHSGGAVFALLMALYESEYFASIAVHAGALDSASIQLIKIAKRKTPIHIQVGNRDPYFPVSIVRETRKALTADGFPVELRELSNHDHWYYDLAPKINLTAWEFLKGHELPNDPIFEEHNFKKETRAPKDSKASATHYNRGTEHLQAGALEKAIIEFSRSIELDPKQSDAHNNRGVAYMGQKNYDAAIADFTRSIELKPTVGAYRNRADIYLTLKKWSEAIAAYSEAINLEPSAESYLNRGRAYVQSGKEELGLADYDRAIQSYPKYARTYLVRGLLALKNGQDESAQKDFDTGFKLDPQLHGEFDPIIRQIKTSRGIN